MSMFDFNDADQQRSGELIPDKTVCRLVMSIRPGGAGDQGWMTAGKPPSDAQYLNCEFTVMDGPFANRKLWENIVLAGGKTNDRGQSIAAEISRAKLRAILESSRNIQPSDMSQAACEKRRVHSWEEFDGIEFVARIGIEKGKNGYEDKNKIAVVITPDKKEYQQATSGQYQAPAPSQQPAQKPAWATGQAPAQQQGQGSSTPPTWANGNSAAPSTQKSTVPSWAQ